MKLRCNTWGQNTFANYAKGRAGYKFCFYCLEITDLNLFWYEVLNDLEQCTLKVKMKSGSQTT